jgi:hydroxymethylglutaryl-CoA lyase/(R)-citramalyl-CoA lyase
MLTICDVGPRDGLQNESVTLDAGVRAELCDRLLDAGLRAVEAASFVNPRLVPQMAGAEEVVAAVRRRGGTVLSGLVLNERGFDRALAAGVDEVHYAFPVTDTFARRNQNTTVAGGLETSHLLVKRAREAGVPITVGLIVAFGCPFEGRVAPQAALAAAEALAEADALVLADTVGVAVPSAVVSLVTQALQLGRPVGVHLHDTRNTAIAGSLAALQAGATSVETSVGGLGGCPFAPGATGNLATEDLVYVLEEEGVKTGVDLDAVIAVSRRLEERLGHPVPAALTRAGGRLT